MEPSLRKVLCAIVAAIVIGLSACGSSDTTTTTPVATPAPNPPAPAPSPREVAKAETINCLQSIPLLKVDTSGGPLAEIEVHADLSAGGGNAMITVFPSHAGALKYSRTFNSGAVGNLAGAIYNYKGSQDFQAAVEGCLL